MQDVSVPLRGYGFEIEGVITHTASITRFPSPCGDMVLKLKEFADFAEVLTDVSVPLRGYGFEILAAGCLAVSGSICRFAARMRSPSFSQRNCVLKTAVCLVALSAAGISLSV